MTLHTHLVMDVALFSDLQSIQVQGVLLVDLTEEFLEHHLSLEQLLRVCLFEVSLCHFLHLPDQINKSLLQERPL
jgi:hypothetical protein